MHHGMGVSEPRVGDNDYKTAISTSRLLLSFCPHLVIVSLSVIATRMQPNEPVVPGALAVGQAVS